MDSTEKINILLVDDSEEKMMALESILNRLGQNLVKARSGKEALRFLLQQEFAVILLDVNMPVMNGFETAALIRQRKKTEHIPIIFITSISTHEMHVFKGYSLGAVDYLFTPIVPEVLKAKVSVFIELFQKKRELQKSNDLLEDRVRERTAELSRTNQMLQEEIADRRKAEQALKKAHDELEQRVRERTAELVKANKALQNEISERKKVESEVLDISAREQRRLGQDLHDGLGQSLTGIAFFSKVLENKLAMKNTPETEDANQIVQMVNEAISRTRQLARGFHPVELDEKGLVAALEEMVGNMSRLFNVPCHFIGDKHVRIYNNDTANQVYRIAQEAVNNAIKHGKAKTIWVELDQKNGNVTLIVKDDGVGISNDPKNAKGMGLHIMKYRAGMINGTFEITGNANRGTQVSCTFPNEKRQGVAKPQTRKIEKRDHPAGAHHHSTKQEKVLVG